MPDPYAKTEQSQSNFAKEEEVLTNFKKISKDDVSTEILVEMINSIQESLKTLSFHLSLKANKEDLDKLIKHMFIDIERNQSKNTDAYTKLENKLRQISNESLESPYVDKQEMVEYKEFNKDENC